VGFIISAVFLAATLAAGWLLPASHHVLHWRCQTHHVACLMLGDILMAIIQLAGDSLNEISCKAVGECARYYCLVNFSRSFDLRCKSRDPGSGVCGFPLEEFASEASCVLLDRHFHLSLREINGILCLC